MQEMRRVWEWDRRRWAFCRGVHPVAEADERSPFGRLTAEEFYARHGVTHSDKPVALSIVQARLVGLAHFSVGYIFTYAAFLIADRKSVV